METGPNTSTEILKTATGPILSLFAFFFLPTASLAHVFGLKKANTSNMWCLWSSGQLGESRKRFIRDFCFNTELFFIHANCWANPSLDAKAAADKTAASREMPFERLGKSPWWMRGPLRVYLNASLRRQDFCFQQPIFTERWNSQTSEVAETCERSGWATVHPIMSVQYRNVMFTLWMRINLTHFGPVSYRSQDPVFPFINSLLLYKTTSNNRVF